MEAMLRRLGDRRWPSRIWRWDRWRTRRRVRCWTLSMHSVETPACARLIRWATEGAEPWAGEESGGDRLLDRCLFDAFWVFGKLHNPLVLLGFFDQPGFDRLGRGGRGSGPQSSGLAPVVVATVSHDV